MELPKRKVAAREILIFFSTMALICIVWGVFELRTSYYIHSIKKKEILIAKIKQASDTIFSLNQIFVDIYFMAPKNLETHLYVDDEIAFSIKMENEANRQELFRKINQGYRMIYSVNGKKTGEDPLKYDYSTGTWDEFNSKFILAIKGSNEVLRLNKKVADLEFQIDDINQRVIYSDDIFDLVLRFSIVLFIIVYPVRIIVYLILWSIQTLHA